MIRLRLPAILLFVATAAAQEMQPPDGGMWTFDNPPTAIVKAKYGFEITPAWLDKVRLGSARVSTGGSSSFVSAKGLVLTNHHVALELVGKLSTTGRDLVKDGFLARSHEEELACPDAEIRQLRHMADVTEEVRAAERGATDPAQAAQAREDAIAAITSREREKTGLVVDVVSFYGGGQYMAYGYKTWTDVRLVFAPEMRIAYFGGDYDNFTYPRYCLDAAFLRVYEDGRPADTGGHFLSWNAQGSGAEELVFVSGHPGDTGRLLPCSALRYERDVSQPVTLAFLRIRERALVRESARSEEDRLRLLDELFGVRNSIKAYTGQQEGLLDARLMARKEQEEAELVERAGEDPALLEALSELEEAHREMARTFPALVFGRPNQEWRAYAQALRAAAEQLGKEPDERDDAWRGDALPARLDELDGRRMAVEPDLVEVLELLARIVPEGEALRETLVRGGGPARMRLGLDRAALGAALGDEAARAGALGELRRVAEEVSSLERALGRAARASVGAYQAAQARVEARMPDLAAARFRVYGKSVPPDATFTLRLTFGRTTGYELGTTLVPWKTTFYGLYARHHEFDGADPFALPPSWVEKRGALELSTPFDFVSTCDIIGGNSGSPVLNSRAEVVGLIFDGNIQSLPGRYHFDPVINRALAVHTAGITEALRKVYGARELLSELGVL